MQSEFRAWRNKIIGFLSDEKAKAVIFINPYRLSRFADYLIEEIASKVKCEIAIVCFSLDRELCFKRPGIRVSLSEDYLARGDYEYIDKFSLDLTRTWYLKEKESGRQISRYGNIHLGSLVEFGFQHFLISRIKNLEVINRVVEIEKPDRFITIEAENELFDAAGIISGYYHLPFLSLNLKRSTVAHLKDRIRKTVSDILYSCLIDGLIMLLIKRKTFNRAILIDPRAYNLLTGPHQLDNFVFCLFERGLPIRKEVLKKRKLYVSFDTVLNRQENHQLFKPKKELLATWDELQNSRDFKGSFKYKGIPIWDLIRPQLDLFFRQSFPLAIRLIENLRRLNKERRIAAVVLRADGRLREKTIIFAARDLGIPTFYLTHGVLGEVNGHDVLYCDKTIVWGQADYQKYLSLGNGPEKLEICGSPKYDSLFFRERDNSKEMICRRLNLQDNKDIVVFATQPTVKFSSYCTDDEQEIILRTVLSAFKNIKDKYLVVKVHPYDDRFRCERMVREMGLENTVVIQDIDIYALIESCSLLITKSSTVGVEAMIFDKPIITINLVASQDKLPYAQRKAALGAYQRQELLPAIERVFRDESLRKEMSRARKELLSYYIDRFDGRASERVVHLIKAMSNHD